MSHRQLAALVAVVVVGMLLPPAVGGQAQDAAGGNEDWVLPRTPDGQPDMQGYWTTQTFTPLERPARLADQEFFSDEEWAVLQEQLTAEGVDPLQRNAITIADDGERERALYQDNRDPSYVHYDNEIWLRTPTPKGLSTRRTSLITHPRNGRLPAMTAAGAARVAHERAMRNNFTGYETRGMMERCIIWAHEGPPMLPPAYNDVHQIFQTPDHFVVFTEISTGFPRMIPIDGRPPLPAAIRQLHGDWRGRWEGDTLVVESGNFVARRNLRGSNEHRHVVERFTRISENEIRYEFTVNDPTTWTSPWSAEVPMIKTEGPMFEYGCHEGNHGIVNILSIARNLERQAAEAAAGTGSR